MNYVILDGTAYLLHLIAVALLAIMLIILTRQIKKLREESESTGAYLDRLLYNSRKRDEKILREVRKAQTSKQQLEDLFSMTDKAITKWTKWLEHLKRAGEQIFVAQSKEVRGLVDYLVTIRGDVRKGNKDQQEIKTRLTHIRNDVDKGTSILTRFDEKVKESEKKGKK